MYQVSYIKLNQYFLNMSSRIPLDTTIGPISVNSFKPGSETFRVVKKLLHMTVHDVRVPKSIGTSTSSTPVELHIFCDAAEKAYGAVAYSRIQNLDGNLIVSLLCSKTRVTPMPEKRPTLPRLGLLSCELAARLVETITFAIKIE